jgi:uncharacterized Zn finger protein
VARKRHLTDFAPRAAGAWKEVDALIATRQSSKYTSAVQLLVDLRDLGVQEGRRAEVGQRLHALREEHASKRTLIERMKKAGFAGDEA